MARGPSYRGRRKPLPSNRKVDHLRVVPDRFRREDRHVGLEPQTVRVRPAIQLHHDCKTALVDDRVGDICPRCQWLSGMDTPDTRYLEFWAMEGGH